MIDYAIKAKKLESAGREVKFAGKCKSACTLLMSLPKNKTCVTKSASFGFHLPYGSSRENNLIAANYMMRKYPGWVRSWIRANGGLTSGIKRMSYSYASQYMKTCDTEPKNTFVFAANFNKNSHFGR